MVAPPQRVRASNLTWEIALLPLLAIVTTAALDLALRRRPCCLARPHHGRSGTAGLQGARYNCSPDRE